MTPAWLREAHRRFGNRSEVFRFVDSPFSLWANLRDLFRASYAPPRAEADIRAIYEYADWSYRQPRGKSAEDDLLTVVAVAFYEHLPEVEAAVRDLPRWLTLDEVVGMRDILSHHAGEEGFRRILEAYPKSCRAGAGRRPRRK